MQAAGLVVPVNWHHILHDWVGAPISRGSWEPFPLFGIGPIVDLPFTGERLNRWVTHGD